MKTKMISLISILFSVACARQQTDTLIPITFVLEHTSEISSQGLNEKQIQNIYLPDGYTKTLAKEYKDDLGSFIEFLRILK